MTYVPLNLVFNRLLQRLLVFGADRKAWVDCSQAKLKNLLLFGFPMDFRKLVFYFGAFIKSIFAGAELVDSVLDVVRKEAESCDCLQVT